MTEEQRQIRESEIFLKKYPEFDGNTHNLSLIENVFNRFGWEWTADNIERAWAFAIVLENL